MSPTRSIIKIQTLKTYLPRMCLCLSLFALKGGISSAMWHKRSVNSSHSLPFMPKARQASGPLLHEARHLLGLIFILIMFVDVCVVLCSCFVWCSQEQILSAVNPSKMKSFKLKSLGKVQISQP